MTHESSISPASCCAGVIHNGQNARLKKGLESLDGVHCGEIPRLVAMDLPPQQCLHMLTTLIAFARTDSYGPCRNCGDDECSGFCVFGCASGSKQVRTSSCSWFCGCSSSEVSGRLLCLVQDVVNTWLCDAVANGARVLTGLHVDEVLLEGTSLGGGGNKPKRSTTGSRTRAKRAVGVSATVAGPGWQPQRQQHGASRSPSIMIKSRVVISSCGALHTPALLLRSGIRGFVGRNLRLHPAVFVAAEFPQAR